MYNVFEEKSIEINSLPLLYEIKSKFLDLEKIPWSR